MFLMGEEELDHSAEKMIGSSGPLPSSPYSALSCMLYTNYHICFSTSFSEVDVIIAVLIFYHCLYYYKFSGFTQNMFLISQFPKVRSWACSNWELCSGSHKTEIKMQARLYYHLMA